jgi:hypothetical protein
VAASRLQFIPVMPMELFTLLRRDHTEVQQALTQLLDPAATTADLRMGLDGVRLGLTAHGEAQDIVLARFEIVPALRGPVGAARAAHLAQEHALSALVSSRPGSTTWRERAAHLRELIAAHAAHEEATLGVALRQHLPVELYARLAGAFATERLRQLAMLQPSAPIFVADYAAEARAS